MKQMNGINMMKELADKMGYKLIKKTKTNPKPILPKMDKDYKEMDSKQLQVELKHLDGKIAKIKADNENVYGKVIEFMNHEPIPEHMKTLFRNNKIDPGKILIFNNELNQMNNLRIYLSELFSFAMEKELREKFTAMNPELGKIIEEVHNISIEESPSGKILRVEMKKSDKKKEETKTEENV